MNSNKSSDRSGYKLAKISLNDLVSNHNDLSSANLGLELNEEKLLFMAMAFYHKSNRFVQDEDKKVKPQDWIEISALDFGCQLHGLDLSKGDISGKEISKAENAGRVALRRLGYENKDIYSKIVQFKKIIDGKLTYVSHSIVTGIMYTPEDKLVKVRFAPEIYDYFTNQNGNFNTFYLKYISVMETRYGAKLYRFLNAHLFKFDIDEKASVEVDYEDLKFALSCENKYKGNPQNFKVRVLDKAIEDIEAHTNLKLSYTVITKNGKTCAIKFDYELIDSFKIIQRIKEIKKEEKKHDKQGIPYFIDGSHFKSKDRVNQMKILESITPNQASFLLSIPEFLSDYSSHFGYTDDTAGVAKKLKFKLLHEYESFNKKPIDFEYYAWIKENNKHGVTETVLKSFVEAQASEKGKKGNAQIKADNKVADEIKDDSDEKNVIEGDCIVVEPKPIEAIPQIELNQVEINKFYGSQDSEQPEIDLPF